MKDVALSEISSLQGAVGFKEGMETCKTVVHQGHTVSEKAQAKTLTGLLMQFNPEDEEKDICAGILRTPSPGPIMNVPGGKTQPRGNTTTNLIEQRIIL